MRSFQAGITVDWDECWFGGLDLSMLILCDCMVVLLLGEWRVKLPRKPCWAWPCPSSQHLDSAFPDSNKQSF